MARKRKRINLKFVWIGTGVVLLLVAAATAFKFRHELFYPAPEEYIARGKQLMEEGKYKEAGEEFYTAGRLREGRGDPELYVLIGDVWNHLAADSSENFMKARSHWESALSADPRYLPALQRLLEMDEDLTEYRPDEASFQRLRETAQRMLAVDPENEHAQFLLHRATLENWRMAGEVQRTAALDSIAALEKFLEENPDHADAMAQIAMAKLNLATEAFRAGDDAGARRSAQEVVALVESALQGQEQNGPMQFRAAQAYQAVAGIEKRLEGDEKKWEELSDQHFERAQQLIKPEDDHYFDVQVFHAARLSQDEKRDEAEKVLRGLMERYPDDLQVWIALAEHIGKDRERVNEALAMLNRPLPDTKEKGGVFALRTLELAKLALLAEIDLRLNLLAGLNEPSEQRAELERIDAAYAKLQSQIGEIPRMQTARGRVEIAKAMIFPEAREKHYVQAIQSFEASLRSTTPQSQRDRLQTMSMLAQAYVNTNQSGQAKRLLQELFNSLKEETPVGLRALLAQVLINENSIEEARPHVEAVIAELPADDPQSIQLQILVLDKEKDEEQRRKLFAKLPQETRQHIFAKARFALGPMQDEELGLQILEGLRAANPADLEVVVGLAQYYATKNKKDQAERVVADALAKAPDNVGLQTLQKQLAADTPEELRAIQEQSVANISDPVRKELRLFELAAQSNDLEKARTHLLNAEKLKPGDPGVLENLYVFHVGQRDFDKAGQYLDRLTKVDPGKGEILRIRFALARQDGARALELANQMTRERGEFALSWLMLGEVHRALGDVMEAANAYRKALDRDNRNLEAMRWLIQCFYQLSQPDEAKRYIDQAARIYPNNNLIRELQLDHEVRHGDPERAIAPRQQQLEQDQENPANWLALGQAYAATANHRQSAGKDQEANPFFQKAKETFNSAYAKWPDDQRFAIALAEVAVRLQQPEEGEKAIRALAERPAWKDRLEPTVLLADYLYAAGKTEQAEKTYRDLLEKTQDVNLQIRLAEILFTQKRVDDALEVLKLNTEHPAIRYARVDMLVRGQRYAEAQKELDGLLAGQQPSAALLDLQGLVHMHAGRAKEAMEAFDKALELDPKFPLALYRRGVLKMMSRGDIDGAIKDLTAAKQLAPALPDARIKLAAAYRARNDFTSAIRELEDSVRDMPADKGLRLALVETYRQAVPPRWGEAERIFRQARNIPRLARDAEMLQAEAMMWSDRKDPQRAVAVIQEAAKVAPGDLSITQTFFDVLVKARAYRDVLATSDRIVKVQPDLWWVYMARGQARAGLNDKDGAVAEFEQALKIANDKRDDAAATQIVRALADDVGFAAAMNRVEPKAQSDNRWRNVAMQLCRNQGDFTAALRWAQTMLEDPNFKGPQRDGVLFAAGEIYCNLGNFDKALELYKQLVASHPEDPAILNNVAAVMSMPDSPVRPEEALVYSTKAYENMRKRGGMEPAILDTHGWILVTVGRVEEGILMLQQALDRQAFPDGYYHLGDAYLRQNKPVEAERALRQAKDLVAQAQRERQAVDPTLSNRIDEALLRASAMLQQQKAQAGAEGT